jgi:hypothetical protein
MSFSASSMIPVIVYTLGALAFCLLSGSYLGEYRRRPSGGSRVALPAFTLVCGAAFLGNLLNLVGILQGEWLVLVRNLAAGLVPPLLVHMILETEDSGLKDPRLWRRMLTGFYLAGAACAVTRALNETGWFLTPAGDALDDSPAALLAAGGVMGIWLMAASRRTPRAGERTHRRRILAVLVLLVLSATATLAGAGMAAPLPDYLLLVFFCLTLYHSERLVFIDLLVKGGLYAAVGILMLESLLWMGAHFPDPSQAAQTYSMTLSVLALWLLGPWIYGRVASTVERRLLSRPYSAAEAERRFIQAIQASGNEEELRECAGRSLGEIFQAAVTVQLHPSMPCGSIGGGSADRGASCVLEQNNQVLGLVRLAERESGIPFLSDDLRLLQSLSSALCLSLENVRFRVERRLQAEREQQLRLLASRSELKALRAQINPHFLFNTLSVIAGLVHCQPELADETIEHLAQVFRYTLRKSENEWAPLGEEVEFVTAYLRIEQARFGERLSVRYEVDPAAAHIPIPAMCIQPLIENAVRHGVSAMEGPGSVCLRAMLAGEVLRLEVLDSGPGFPSGFSLERAVGGHGLRNVAERLRGYYGESASLFWECGEDGTRVVLIFPRQAAISRAGKESFDPRFAG